MADSDRDTVLARVAALRVALEAASASEAADRARYHAERLELAVRHSHAEGIRFAAYTIAHALGATDAFDERTRAAFAALRQALEAAGHHF